jgi:hypothetical protein
MIHDDGAWPRAGIAPAPCGGRASDCPSLRAASRRRRAALALGLALCLAAGVAGPAPRAEPPASVAWTGRLRCDALPGRVQGPLDVDFSLVVTGDRARYERDIRDPASVRTGVTYWERGEGVVAPDGSLRLSGYATGRDWSYTTRFEGRLDASGAGELRGAQSWRSTSRACVIQLRRAGA